MKERERRQGLEDTAVEQVCEGPDPHDPDPLPRVPQQVEKFVELSDQFEANKSEVIDEYERRIEKLEREVPCKFASTTPHAIHETDASAALPGE